MYGEQLPIDFSLGGWEKKWKTDYPSQSFHTKTVNQYLVKHVDKLTAGKKSHILVPCCGKSVAMKYLYDLGHDVVGVEWIPRAIEEFFTDNKISFKSESVPFISGTLFTNADKRIRLYCCDFYMFTPEVEGIFDCIWEQCDFAAIQSTAGREKYSKHLKNLLSPGGRILIENPECANEDPYPPYPVSLKELEHLFGDECCVNAIETYPSPLVRPKHWPKLIDLKGQIRLMTKKETVPRIA